MDKAFKATIICIFINCQWWN